MDTLDPKVKELAAIAASVAANCEPCFKYHYDQARRLGIPLADMAAAVSVAEAVKQSPSRKMRELTERILRNEMPGDPPDETIR